MPRNYIAVDLFAGGGGLTVGLKNAGFKVAVAVENESHAVATYKANHPEVHVFKQDIRQIRPEDILERVPGGRVHLLTGCPPCQSFSSLTSKHKGRIDERDSLILEVARLAEGLRPSAVMVENVPGLRHDENRYFKQFRDRLTAMGYQLTWGVLQVADFGVPQFRRRLVLMAGRGFEIELPAPTHSRDGDGGRPAWLTLRDAIGTSEAPLSLSEARKRGGPSAVGWHVIRDMRPITVARFNSIKAGENRTRLPENLRPGCHRASDTGFTNVYGRMTWHQTPVTITAGCLTASTGRFGHPDEPRTISLREAATIQTFPEDYIFDTDEIKWATTIVGNAFPCKFAAKLGESCIDALAVATDAGGET